MQKIKTFILANCPHCSKDVFIAMETLPVQVSKVYRPEELAIIKEKLKKDIDGLGEMLSPEDKKSLFDNIDNQDSIFDPDDASEIINEIIQRANDKTKKSSG